MQDGTVLGNDLSSGVHVNFERLFVSGGWFTIFNIPSRSKKSLRVRESYVVQPRVVKANELRK